MHVCVFTALCSGVYAQCESMYVGVCFLVHVCILYAFLLCFVFVSDNQCMSVFACVSVCVCACMCPYAYACLCLANCCTLLNYSLSIYLNCSLCPAMAISK